MIKNFILKNNSPSVFIIAEIGVNHNGSIKIAKKLIQKAKKIGADAVKFQTFKADNLALKKAPKANYQKKNYNKKFISQYGMLKSLEFTNKMHIECIKECKKNNIYFLSSPFDLESILYLKKLGLRTFKIPSGEITNYQYLKLIGSLNYQVIMSTGMSTLSEIKEAIRLLNVSGTKKKNINLLHCNTEYPTPFEDANLNAIKTLKEKFKINVGYSDHTQSIEASLAAVALGAKIIEKHITINNNFSGPDHKASLDVKEFSKLVEKIRNIEKALGRGKKIPTKSEIKNIPIVRKSLVALKDIEINENFSKLNLTAKRPGIGISPMKFKKLIKKKAKKKYKKNEIIVL